jgi:KAP family P-loop domain
MHADKPINTSTEDRFGRSNFAKSVAAVISDRIDPSSLVVSIHAAWGEGKTSVLNMIVEELRSHEGVLLVPFNPWRFPDENQLLQEFFSTLAQKFDASLKTKGEKLSDIADKYAAVLSPIPIAGRGLEGLIKGYARDRKNADLETLRTRIEAILARSNCRIVVIMDDIDRLDNEEIHAIFRLVKLSADFPNTTYILAFDEKRVAEALGTKYGSPEAGRNFLEKIIQIPLPLPPASVNALREMALDGISSALDLAKIEFVDDQRLRFSEVFDKAFLRRVLTPRVARRFTNALTFILPITKSEVDPVDMIFLEAVRAFYPNVYKSIRENSGIYSGSVRLSLGLHDEQEIKQKTSDLIENATKDLVDEDSKAALVAIQALFPSTGASGLLTGIPGREGSGKKRISSPDYFPRYFNYGVPPDDISDTEVEEFLSELDFFVPYSADSKFEAMLANGRGNVVISKMRLFEDELPPRAAQNLASILARNGDKLPPSHPTDTFFGLGAYAQTTMLLRHLLQSLPDESEREKLALKIAEEIRPLPFALEYTRLGRPIKRDQDSDEMVPVVSTECESRIRSVIGARISKFGETEAIEIVYPLDAQELYQFWFATDPDSLCNQLRSRITSHPEQAARFVAAVVGIGPARELETQFDFAFPQQEEWYELLGKIIDPDKLATALKQTTASLPQPRKKSKKLTAEERAAKWFLQMRDRLDTHTKKTP